MADDSFLDIGETSFFWAKYGYYADVLALFAEDELADEEASGVGEDLGGNGAFYGYRSQACLIRDRLQLQGFTATRARHDFHEALAAARRQPVDENHSPGDVQALEDDPRMIDRLRAAINDPNAWNEPAGIYLFPATQILERIADPRSFLRLAVDLVDSPDTPVSYDLTAFSYEDTVLPVRGRALADEVRAEKARDMPHDAPLIVLTEGSSDSHLLADAVQITHPHLDGFLRFMDFDGGAEGSAGALVKMVRSLGGTGITNRVIAIADNDTAGYDAFATLMKASLPSNFRVVHYPDLPLLSSYPTLGPQADQPVLVDINRRAGSLEMYLGEDLLTMDGELAPVQWTGYVDRQRAYQGELAGGHKRRVQEAFRSKVKLARQDPSARAEQDWTGVTAIVETILHAFD